MTDDPIRPLESRDGLYGSVVTGYADARAALADPRLSKDPRLAPQDWQEAGRGRPLEDRSGLGTHLLTTDPPEHTRLRRLVSTALSARRVEAMRERIQLITDTLIDGFAEGSRSEVDLISEFAFPLPVTVICELLGVPAEDHFAFRQWTSDVVSSGAGREDARPAALRCLHDHVTALIDTRRRHPADDLVSALITAHDDEDRLTGRELIAMIFLLLITGHETTVNMIGNGILALLRHPGQLALLQADPDLLEPAIEEILRYDSPVSMATWRFASEPMEIGGVPVPPGQPLLVSIADANHDPRAFTAPERFDITADRPPHVSFGLGIHYCVGAALARLEGQIAIGTLLRRLPGLALAVSPDDLHWRTSLTLHGLETLPVRIR